MPRRRAEAFVLRTHPVGEADLVVTLLTAEEGRVRAVAKSARRSLKRFGAALQPLTRVTAHWQEFESDRLSRLESCDTVRSYVEEQRDPRLFHLFAYLAEVAAIFAREREADPRFFRLVGAVLEAGAGGLPPRGVRRYFDLWTLRLQGILPELERCAGCGRAPRGAVRVAIGEGGLRCGDCAAAGEPGEKTVRLSAAALAAAGEALRRGPADAAPALAAPGLEGLDTLCRLTMLRFTEQPLRTLRPLEEIESAS